MAGGLVKYRHLSRKSSHRKALLRNLVTSLIEHESISTTWPKAKEAQRLAEKLITLAKKNTEASRRRAHSIFFRPFEMVPKLFGPIRERYLDRPGGYTRVLRIEPIKEDQAPSAILELVDGPKDIRFAMTAKAIAGLHSRGKPINEITSMNIAKVTRFRKNGQEELEALVEKFERLGEEQMLGLDEVDEYEQPEYDDHGDLIEKTRRVEEPKKRKVYPSQFDKPKKARNTRN